MHPTDKNENAKTILMMIEELTQDEGDRIVIYNPNPDFGGDDYAVGHSTDFAENEEIFTGNTLLECLEKIIK